MSQQGIIAPRLPDKKEDPRIPEQPTPLNDPLFKGPFSLIDLLFAILEAIFTRLKVEQKELFNTTIIHIMQEKNIEFLSKQLKMTGYGEGHTDMLRENIQKQPPAFTLFHQQDFGKDNTVTALHLKKSETSDMYFFNRATMMLKNAQYPDTIKQTFFINNNQSNVTLKEGYNLLSGRAVEKDLENKDGQKYRAWLQLDFKNTDKHGNYETKQYHKNYGFDLEKTVATLPLKDLGTEETKTRLLESLQRGNRQSVTLQVGDTERKVYIEAAPRFKALNFYDEQQKRVNLQTLLTPDGTAQSAKQVAKKEKTQKEAAGGEDSPAAGQSAKKSRKKGQSISG
jgi:choline dehydrogenase-like flavoprotein